MMRDIPARLLGKSTGFLTAAMLIGACSGELGSGGQPGPSTGGPGGKPAGTGGAGVGTPGDPTKPGAPGTVTPPGTPVVPPATAACKMGADPGPSPLFKLSTVQYRNTVKDLLAQSGIATVVDEVKGFLSSVPEDSTPAFRGMDNRISLDHLQGYFNVAVGVGDAVAGRPERLIAAAGMCATAATLTPTCVDQFLAGFGRRAFRRPLTAEEVTSFKQLNDGTRPPAEAVRAMIITFLTSPRFLNHLEIEGTPIMAREDYLQLSPFEIASRISYQFWQSMPDDELFKAASDGSLVTEAGFQKQVERIFRDPRTQDTTWQFWNEWFQLGKFPGFAADRPAFKALAAGTGVTSSSKHHPDMVQEARDLTELFTWKQKGTLAQLLTTNLSVTKSPELAKLYGVAAWSGSGAYPTLPDGQRAGLLQRGAILANPLEQTNPFVRGSHVRRLYLCDPLPLPDPNALPPGALDPPPVSTAETTRQRYQKKTDGNSLCNACHNGFNDIGYVLEAYDALGRFRTTEKVYDEKNGMLLGELPIDTTAIAKIDLTDVRPVMGPADLNKRIVDSKKVETCLATNYVRYTFRREDTPGDACAIDDLAAQLGQAAVGLDDVFKRIALQQSFRRRKVATP